MKVPSTLASAFDAAFEEFLAQFAAANGLIPEAASLKSDRFLSRSVVPHIEKLSGLFNRISDEEEAEKKIEAQKAGLPPYWKASSNPENLKLAYFLYFMPCNLFRVASVWAELSRLGFRWAAGETLRAVEFGAGPASGACGIAAGEKHAPTGMPRSGSWALIEQDRAVLELGSRWAESYFGSQDVGEWAIRPFHRKLSLAHELLPRNAPRFNLWLMSFFLNEASESPGEIAKLLLSQWERHLEEEGLVILVEPALKLQSRKLLEIRRALLREMEKKETRDFQILLPCLGHQACGALAAAEDWCHEDVMWWRPPYLRLLDKMAGLDRKSLPFSYLVVARSKRSLEELLPALSRSTAADRLRLVSPAHAEGKDHEFYVCGQDGKRKVRYRPKEADDTAARPERGDVLLGAKFRGEANATRIDSITGLV